MCLQLRGVILRVFVFDFLSTSCDNESFPLAKNGKHTIVRKNLPL